MSPVNHDLKGIPWHSKHKAAFSSLCKLLSQSFGGWKSCEKLIPGKVSQQEVWFLLQASLHKLSFDRNNLKIKKKKLTKNQQAIRVTLKTMNCVNNERSKCPWTALTCLYLAEALAGVSVGLINTFLGPKSPCCSQTRSDTRVGASRSCCAFRALVNPGLMCFLGQQLLTLPCLQQWQPWCHQDLPDVYRASGAPGQDKQHPVALLDLCLCSSSSASSAGGNFSSGCPRRILVTEQEHKVCSTGVGAFRKMREQGPDELRAFPFNKSSSYLPFCCKVWRGIRLLMLALLSPGSWLTPYPFWSLL